MYFIGDLFLSVTLKADKMLKRGKVFVKAQVQRFATFLHGSLKWLYVTVRPFRNTKGIHCSLSQVSVSHSPLRMEVIHKAILCGTPHSFHLEVKAEDHG